MDKKIISKNEVQCEAIKKDNKRASVKFYIILVLCGIAGGIGGFLTIKMNAEEGMDWLSDFMNDFVYANGFAISLVMLLIITLLTVVLTVIIFKSTADERKNAEIFMKEDNSEKLEKIEKKQSLNLWMTNGLMMLHFFFFSIIIFMGRKTVGTSVQILISIFSSAIIFIVGSLICIKIQQRIIDLLRIMNPEKEGSIYDFKFSKKWEKSCDEAELMRTYRAGYKAFRAVTYLSLGLWTVFMFIGIGTGAGFLPAIIVLIIWTVSTCVYSYYTI